MASASSQHDISSVFEFSVIREFRSFVCTSMSHLQSCCSSFLIIQAFPSELQNPGHNPYFSLEDPEEWVSADAVNAYLAYLKRKHFASLPDFLSVSHSTPKELKDFRSFVIIVHVHFNLKNSDLRVSFYHQQPPVYHSFRWKTWINGL
jgi:hypothetical protein